MAEDITGTDLAAAAVALAESGYRYTDPIADPAFPRIGASTGEDVFPDGWGAEATERDIAAAIGATELRRFVPRALSLTDYSRTAASRGWGPGWPSCQGVTLSGGTAVVTADTSGTRMSVHKRIARLVDILIDATERVHGFRLKPGQCGGYNCRAIAGTKSPSNHSWALAVDLNWNDNTFNSTGKHTLPVAVARMWNRYGFAWGGDYSGAKKDWMHLEFMGTPAEADALTALAIRELLGAGPAPVVVTPTPAAGASSLPSLAFGQTSAAVGSLQRFCNAYGWRPALPLLKVDNQYGPSTAAVLQRAQAQMGVSGDGRNVGPQTKAALWARGWRG